jgi:putative transposase
MPLALTVAGANRHDVTLLEDTLANIVIEQPVPTAEQPQHVCLDAAYDSQAVYALLDAWGFTAHIRARGEEAAEKVHIPGYRARRWVVERSHSWMNRFRRLLVRWEKKSQN